MDQFGKNFWNFRNFKNFWKNLNKSLNLSTRPLNITYWKSKQLDYNQSNMDGDTGTADVEPNDAESTQASISQCKPTNCKYDNDKYKSECFECKRLVHYGCTSPPTYQLQLFFTKRYLKSICYKCVEIPSNLHAIYLNWNEAHIKTGNRKGNSRSKKKGSLRLGIQITIHLLKLKNWSRRIWNNLGKTLWQTCFMS